MIYVLVALTAVVVLGAVLVGRLEERAPRGGPRRLWAVVRATTLDGVVAHVQVEYTLEALPGAPVQDDLATRADVAVEDALRRLIGTRTVSALPGPGDDPGWDRDQLLPGARIDNVTVTASEVEVTAELRRLVLDRRAS